MLEHFATAFAAHAAWSGVEASLRQAFQFVAKKRPELEEAAVQALATNNAREAEHVFEEAVNAIIGEAQSGSIKIDGATMTALRGIKFDHQHGMIFIGNTTISAGTLVTGGSAGSTGKTTVGERTTLATKGTKIEALNELSY
jgi:hypothetical protein